jgi:hypothetical protein
MWTMLDATKKGAPVGAPFGLALFGGVAHVVSAHHAFDTTLCVDDSLLAGPEGVALAADFSPQTFLCGADFPLVAAGTSDYC